MLARDLRAFNTQGRASFSLACGPSSTLMKQLAGLADHRPSACAHPEHGKPAVFARACGQLEDLCSRRPPKGFVNPPEGARDGVAHGLHIRKPSAFQVQAIRPLLDVVNPAHRKTPRSTLGQVSVTVTLWSPASEKRLSGPGDCNAMESRRANRRIWWPGLQHSTSTADDALPGEMLTG